MFNKMIKALERELIGQPKEWYPVKDTVYYQRMSDKDIEDMQMRNEEAIKKCIKKMGKKWVLHSSHKVTRI